MTDAPERMSSQAGAIESSATLNGPLFGPDRPVAVMLLVLTAVTGLIDAVSYLALGQVFTANMTGNVVFLGFAAAGSPGHSVPRLVAAVAAFLIGAALGGRIASSAPRAARLEWTTLAFATEALVLLAATLTAIGSGTTSLDSTRSYALIMLTAVAMGLRNATTRRIGVPDTTTTVLTQVMTALAAESSIAGGSNPRWRRRVASIILMFAGAAAGALLLRHSLVLPLALATLATAGAAAASRVRSLDVH